ncbi:MAG: hypothetical protein M3P30_13775 [Chloroflexota bacterium]|nr:hypothetical protein [Chloroflexota bacterium]
MHARQIGRPNATSQARLQLILVLLAAWDFIAFLLELTNTRLLQIGNIDGALGARSVSGTMAVLAVAYVYAARNPVRYRFILWMATLEQFVALFAGAFHWARSDVGFAEVTIPILVASGFLVMLLTNLPRQTDTV